MARGYRQVQPGEYLYRQAGRGGEREYRVERIVFDRGGAAKVAVREVPSGTVANPGLPQHPEVRFWSLEQIDVDRTHWCGFNRVTDWRDRTLSSRNFDRMVAAGRRQLVSASGLRERVSPGAGRAVATY